CYSINPLGFGAVTRNCLLQHVLVIQAYAHSVPTPSATNQTYLDAVLDSLSDFNDVSSYSRTALDFESRVDPIPPTGDRWFQNAATPEDQISQVPASQMLHTLDYYDSFVIETTQAGRSYEHNCVLTVGGAAISKPCAIVYHYRATSDPNDIGPMTHH